MTVLGIIQKKAHTRLKTLTLKLVQILAKWKQGVNYLYAPWRCSIISMNSNLLIGE